MGFKVDNLTKENAATMIMTNAGDWNVDFFKKNGYMLRGELKDVPNGHNCYELYNRSDGRKTWTLLKY